MGERVIFRLRPKGGIRKYFRVFSNAAFFTKLFLWQHISQELSTYFLGQMIKSGVGNIPTATVTLAYFSQLEMPWGVEWVIAGHCHRPGSTEAQKSFNYLPPTTITCQPPVDMTPMKWQINRNVQIQIPQKARVVLEPDFTLYLFKNNLMHLSYTILYLLMSTTVPSWSASSQLNIHRIPLFHKQ